MRWIDDELGYGEAIIRDVKRVDTYPNIDDVGKGISPWFRVAIIGLYHKGIKIGLRYYPLKYDRYNLGWRHCDIDKSETYDTNALLVGKIPFEWLVNIDWKGDEYYFIPHIYCRFYNNNKEPYEELVYCVKKQYEDAIFYEEIASFRDVCDLSKNT